MIFAVRGHATYPDHRMQVLGTIAGVIDIFLALGRGVINVVNTRPSAALIQLRGQ
ncbi:hypothetical protein ACVJBD_005728 [Rhizobium mongolense]